MDNFDLRKYLAENRLLKEHSEVEMWDNMGEEERLYTLLSYIDDPDEAESYVDSSFDELPDPVAAQFTGPVEPIKEGRDAVCAVCGEHGYDEDLDIDCSKCGGFAWSSDYEGLGKKFDDVYENKPLKEDEQPTHRIKTDVYYIKDYEGGGMEFQGEAVPAYEIADPEENILINTSPASSERVG
jgi:hypothetical protein